MNLPWQRAVESPACSYCGGARTIPAAPVDPVIARGVHGEALTYCPRCAAPPPSDAWWLPVSDSHVAALRWVIAHHRTCHVPSGEHGVALAEVLDLLAQARPEVTDGSASA